MWLPAQVYQHEIKVIIGNIWANKCHITMVFWLQDDQYYPCQCVHRWLCRYLRKYLRKYSAGLRKCFTGLHRSRLYKGVETRALGDSKQTPVREGSSLWTKELRGDPVLGVSNLVRYCPIQGGNRAWQGKLFCFPVERGGTIDRTLDNHLWEVACLSLKWTLTLDGIVATWASGFLSCGS